MKIIGFLLGIISTIVAAEAQPVITQQPTNQTVFYGSNAIFGVSVSGAEPFSYQWQFNGANLGTNFGTNLPAGIITTVAGNGAQYGGMVYSGDGGAATNALLMGPSGVAVDASGNLFIAGDGSQRIHKVDTNGIITTVAGNGYGEYAYQNLWFSGDGGIATNAELNLPNAVAVDANGNLFISDFYNGRIRKVDANGIITTVAGSGNGTFSGDGGAATNATLGWPTGVAVDGCGNLFIADFENQRIRKVDTNGIITTVAGNGTNSFSGDGGAATNAALNSPYSVTVDTSGNFFIADSGNQRIRKVDTSGIITTIAGNGTNSFSGDGGGATNAALSSPRGVVVDTRGNLFIADYVNNRIRKVNTNGIITTVTGNGNSSYNDLGGFVPGGFSGDGGDATTAALFNPCELTLDTSGNLFIADSGNQRIRKVAWQKGAISLALNSVSPTNSGDYSVIITSSSGCVTSSVAHMTVVNADPPSISTHPLPLAVAAGTSLDLEALANGTAPLTYQWQNSAGIIAGQTNSGLI